MKNAEMGREARVVMCVAKLLSRGLYKNVNDCLFSTSSTWTTACRLGRSWDAAPIISQSVDAQRWRRWRCRRTGCLKGWPKLFSVSTDSRANI